MDIEILNDLRYKPKNWGGANGVKMHVRQLYPLLGIEEKGKLPEHSFGPVMIGNTKVWIRSKYQRHRSEGRRSHRVMAECAHCFATVPASRLHQHVGTKRCEAIKGRNTAK